MVNFWPFGFSRSKRNGNKRPTRLTEYGTVISPVEDTRPSEEVSTRDLERRRDRQGPHEPQRLQRRVSQRNRKIKHEDLFNVLGRNAPKGSTTDLLEDEIIPGKAIVLKMPERSMRSYFIPLPIDLDVVGLKSELI